MSMIASACIATGSASAVVACAFLRRRPLLSRAELHALLPRTDLRIEWADRRLHALEPRCAAANRRAIDRGRTRTARDVQRIVGSVRPLQAGRREVRVDQPLARIAVGAARWRRRVEARTAH